MCGSASRSRSSARAGCRATTRGAGSPAPTCGTRSRRCEAILALPRCATTSGCTASRRRWRPTRRHPDLPQFHDAGRGVRATSWPRSARCARELDIRLSSHPGQYIVLNSEDAAVQAARDPRPRGPGGADGRDGPRRRRPSCVLHVGGGQGDALRPLRGRLRAALGRRAGAAGDRERRPHLLARRRARAAPPHRPARRLGHPAPPLPRPGRHPGPRGARAPRWRPGPPASMPKIHYSTPKTALEERKRRVGRRVVREWVLPPLRAHADLIDPIAFGHFLRETAAGLDFDVMLEAKGKDLALLRLREQLGAGNRASPPNLTRARARIGHNTHAAHEHARGHAAQRPVPARRPDRRGRDVDGLSGPSTSTSSDGWRSSSCTGRCRPTPTSWSASGARRGRSRSSRIRTSSA